jgi:hypothetical protein
MRSHGLRCARETFGQALRRGRETRAEHKSINSSIVFLAVYQANSIIPPGAWSINSARWALLW